MMLPKIELFARHRSSDTTEGAPKIRWIKAQKQAQCRCHRTPNHVTRGCNSREICVALSRVTEIGEQAAAAVAASIAGGGPVVRGQLIASRFYEAMQRELRQLPTHDPKRAALIAASDRCQRITAARINPSALLDELRKAIAVLRADTDASAPPTTARPLLRLIEGGLSKD
jgi:hypothetical protein